MIYRIPQKGQAVLFTWLSFINVLLAPIFFWQGVWFGVAFSICALVGYAWLFLWIKNFWVSCTDNLIHVNMGVVFRTGVNIPRVDIRWHMRCSTPLLRLARCEILVFATGGRLICVCPALLIQDVESIGV